MVVLVNFAAVNVEAYVVVDRALVVLGVVDVKVHVRALFGRPKTRTKNVPATSLRHRKVQRLRHARDCGATCRRLLKEKRDVDPEGAALCHGRNVSSSLDLHEVHDAVSTPARKSSARGDQLGQVVSSAESSPARSPRCHSDDFFESVLASVTAASRPRTRRAAPPQPRGSSSRISTSPCSVTKHCWVGVLASRKPRPFAVPRTPCDRGFASTSSISRASSRPVFGMSLILSCPRQ